MPNMKLGPEAYEPQIVEQSPKLFAPEYRHNLIDTEVVNPQNIITQLSGYPLIVDYYSQILGRDQDTDGYNATQDTPFQQYMRIKNVKLKVSSPFNYSMNLPNATDEITGDANFYIPGLRPKEGDVFLAYTGAGRLGMFTVKNPQGLSWFDKDRAYHFDFRLTTEAYTNVVADLDSRVVDKRYYYEEFINNGQDPLITEEEYFNLANLTKLEKSMTVGYLVENFSQEYCTLLLPGQSGPSYDPYVVQFITNLFDTYAHPYMSRLRNLNVDDRNTRRYVDVYTMLIERDPSLLHLCFTEASLVPVGIFSKNKQYGTVAFSGLTYTVYPKQPINGPDQEYGYETGYATGTPIANDEPGTFLIDGIPSIDPISSDGTYLFQASFYDETRENESVLGTLVMSYLNNEAINVPKLIQLCNQRRFWSKVDRFYYTPILVMLARAATMEI